MGSMPWPSKPALNKHQLRLDAIGESFQFGREPFQILGPRCAERHGQIQRRAQARAAAGFVGIARARIKRKSMDRQEADLLVAPEQFLRAVAVMYVPIDHQHAVEPAIRRSAMRAPIATLLNRQKPIAASGRA